MACRVWVKAAGQSSHSRLGAREGHGGGGWSKQYLHLAFGCEGGASGDGGQSECRYNDLELIILTFGQVTFCLFVYR
jgi:hypothetical protein